jgi:endonuclease/exonuclease/phosphatase (EEP) superfamily protein YafD
MLNGALALAPLAFSAGKADSRSLRIVSFNVLVVNPTPEAVVRFLADTQADIVVLQEVDARLEAAIVPALAAIYPNAVSCARLSCGLVLLAKEAPIESGFMERTSDHPPVVWARFAGAGGSPPFTVTGTHLAVPFQPEWQARQIRALAERLHSAEGTQIIAGDFNLTPFSWKLNWLSAATGFRRHATLGFSWPAVRYPPVVLIDNLLATPDVRSAEVRIGASGHGSDHRPVVFDLALE